MEVGAERTGMLCYCNLMYAACCSVAEVVGRLLFCVLHEGLPCRIIRRNRQKVYGVLESCKEVFGAYFLAPILGLTNILSCPNCEHSES